MGRLFLASKLSTEPPFRLQTARYARHPFDAFGYGAQVHYRDGPLSLVLDITGDPSLRFNQEGQFDHVASSARLTYGVSETLTVGASYQISPDFDRFGVEATYREGAYMVNAVAYTTESTEGGWVFVQREVGNDLFIHGRADFQSGGDDRYTIGVRKDFGRFRAVVDWEDGDLFGRVQLQF